jgi:hypothetical protein
MMEAGGNVIKLFTSVVGAYPFTLRSGRLQPHLQNLDYAGKACQGQTLQGCIPSTIFSSQLNEPNKLELLCLASLSSLE